MVEFSLSASHADREITFPISGTDVMLEIRQINAFYPFRIQVLEIREGRDESLRQAHDIFEPGLNGCFFSDRTSLPISGL